MQKIVVTSQDDGSREDFNSYYCGYLLVCSDTMSFDEAVFQERFTHEDLIVELRRLGYTVTEPDVGIVVTKGPYDDEEDEDEDE